ncbi:MAG TPA: DUF2723 domain-containing protein, partial [Bacteroidia bacterium]|nr:DUF2723 domain-containing protein [Bacteroidia bacterium]
PPGAPLHHLLGRLFSLLAFGNVEKVAFWVNMLSAISSAFCVYFTYHMIVLLAAKIIPPLTNTNYLSHWGAGIAGALTLTFTDTFWFSAVEAEVYALSSCFTMLVFWAALKWDESRDNRWLLFIALAAGLSVGVHLLNLLVLPAVVYIVYYSAYRPTVWGFLLATVIGFGILLFIQFGIIPGIPLLAAIADRWTVNSLNLPMATGAWAVIALLAIACFILVFISRKKQVFHLISLSITFLLIGYSCYLTVPIRAAASPPLNINAPKDPFTFVSYLNREQYGQRALVYGPYFNAPLTKFKTGKPIWRPLNGKYVIAGYTTEYEFNPEYMTFFPRMGDVFSGSKAAGYVGWTDVDKTQPPAFADNLEFFFKYQVLHMYIRYHLWNFAGRQNDIQGHGNALHGNSVSGIPLLDNLVAAPAENAPNNLAGNKARNYYYFLPLLLGLAGLFYHAGFRSFYPVLALFLFTGLFLVIYLNGPPFEPRERDYVFVGSFQVFCVWIGLGALWLMRIASKYSKAGIWIGFGVAMVVSPVLLAVQNWGDHNRSNRTFIRDFARNYLENLEPDAILFVYGDNDTYPLWYLQNVEGVRTDVRVINANLLNTDWAAYQLAQKQYGSEPIKLTISPDMYMDSRLDVVRVQQGNDSMSLQEALAFAGGNEEGRNYVTLENGSKRGLLPVSKLYFRVNAENFPEDNFGLLENDTASAAITEYLTLRYSSSAIYKAELIMLDIIANNYFKRPIYFSGFSEAENLPQLNKHLRLDGMAYRLVPLKYPDTTGYFNRLNTAIQDSLLHKMEFSGYSNPNVFVDEESFYTAQHYRNLFSIQCKKLLMENKYIKAAETAIDAIKHFPVKTIDYKNHEPALVFIESLCRGNKKQEAGKFTREFIASLAEKLAYYKPLETGIADYPAMMEVDKCIQTLQQLEELLVTVGEKEQAAQVEKLLYFYSVKQK